MKKTKPLISVIVPIYNISDYINDCLMSVVNQTYKDIEIILVDDRSTDSSGKVCDDWAKKDNRIKVIHKKKNEGLNMARFSGWEVSSGDFIAFVDGDDMIDERYIESLYMCIQKSDADIAAVGYRFFQHNEKPTIQENKTYHHKVFTQAEVIKHHATQQQYIPSFHGNLTTVHCKLYKRAIVNSVDWAKSNYSIGEDDFFSLMCYAASQKIALAYTELYYYRVSPNSISRSKELNVRYNGEKVSIFTLVRNYKDLSTRLLGADFFDETQYRTYVLYVYYINLLHTKDAWTDYEFNALQDGISRDVQEILDIKKYRINKKLLEDIGTNGSIKFFINSIHDLQHELSRVYAEKDKIYTELESVRAEKDAIYAQSEKLKTELRSYLGVGRSAKLFAGNIKRRVIKPKN